MKTTPESIKSIRPRVYRSSSLLAADRAELFCGVKAWFPGVVFARRLGDGGLSDPLSLAQKRSFACFLMNPKDIL